MGAKQGRGGTRRHRGSWRRDAEAGEGQRGGYPAASSGGGRGLRGAAAKARGHRGTARPQAQEGALRPPTGARPLRGVHAAAGGSLGHVARRGESHAASSDRGSAEARATQVPASQRAGVLGGLGRGASSGVTSASVRTCSWLGAVPPAPASRPSLPGTSCDLEQGRFLRFIFPFRKWRE